MLSPTGRILLVLLRSTYVQCSTLGATLHLMQRYKFAHSTSSLL